MDNADACRLRKPKCSGSIGYVMAGAVESSESLFSNLEVKMFLFAFTYLIPNSNQ